MSLHMSYDPSVDVLLIEVSKRPIDYLEILDASQFVTQATATSLLAKAEKAEPLTK